MPAIQIIPATREHLPAITAIYAHEVRTGTATFELEPPDLAEMTRRFEALAAAGFPYIVAVREDVVIGYAYAGPYRPRPAYRFTVENSVYLDTSARGQRIGSRLMQALIAESETRGYRLMVAVIGDSANTASIGVHRAAGFRHAGTFRNVGLKFGRWLDTVMMERPLGEAAATVPLAPSSS
jgi:L-amino acid N-acyltransferase YncA